MEMPGLLTLSDRTKVKGKTWEELKNIVMKPGFIGSKVLKEYSKEDNALLLSLRTA